MNFLRLRGLYRGGIILSELKPCDLWEGKKPSSTNLSACLD